MSGKPVTIGLILAGGRSRRMGGGDKFLLPLGHENLLERTRRRLAPQVDRVIVSVNGNAASVAGTRLESVEDLPGLADRGPLGGVVAGLRWAAGEAGAESDMLSVPADTPFLPLDLSERLRAARQATGAEIAVAASVGHVHFAVALWPVGLAAEMTGWLLGQQGSAIHAFLAGRSVATVDFAGPYDSLLNVNTPPDLERARAVAERFSV
jgi:molybdopterin-guanine dinucleotide biosynthesis protein A